MAKTEFLNHCSNDQQKQREEKNATVKKSKVQATNMVDEGKFKNRRVQATK